MGIALFQSNFINKNRQVGRFALNIGLLTPYSKTLHRHVTSMVKVREC